MRKKVDPLKIEMIAAKISQKDMAHHLDVHVSQLNRWLNLGLEWPQGMRLKASEYIAECCND